MMNCAAAASVLDLYQEGRLTPSRSAEVARHLKSCPACAELEKPVLSPGRVGRAPSSLKEALKKSLAAPSPAPAPEPRRALPVREGLRLVEAGALAAAAALLLFWSGPAVPWQGNPSDGAYSVRRLP